MVPSAIVAALFSLAAQQGQADVAVSFSRDIRPIIADKCFACHGPDEAARKQDMRFDVKDGLFGRTELGADIVVPGEPGKSELYYRITHSDDDERMPPSDFHLELPPAEIEIIRRWIEEGAVWQGHWAFVAPSRPSLPTVADETWGENEIDTFILNRLAAAGLTPSKRADKATLVRRVSLDLTGLPPTPSEVDAFIEDGSTDAYGKVVDRLLDAPSYGERMAFPWLDAARYSDTNGYQRDTKRFMWHWRDWVIQAFNDNMPFDQFTIEQLAGDLLPDSTLSQKIATGFNRNHRINGEGGIIPQEYAVEYVVDRVATTSTTWMGLTMGCARCHEHKFDPISQKEFYEFYDFFNRVPEQGKGREAGNDVPIVRVATPEQLSQTWILGERITQAEYNLQAPNARLDRMQKEWEKQVAAMSDELDWRHIRPTEVLTLGEEAVETLQDNSLLISGVSPNQEVYEVTFTAEQAINSFRIELLLDDRLPQSGPGRSETGNAIITGFEVRREPAESGGQKKPIPVAHAFADFAGLDGDFAIGNAIDENEESGWSVGSDTKRENRVAVFVLEEEDAIQPGDRVTIVLKQQSPETQHTIGRFRLSASRSDAFARWAQPSLGDWYSVGPMRLEGGGNAFDAVLEPEEGFDPDRTYRGDLHWQLRADWEDGKINTLGSEPSVANFLYRKITAYADTTFNLSLGSRGPIAVWLDGRLVLSDGTNGKVVDQDRLTLELGKGDHELLIKSVKYQGEGSFYFKGFDDGGETLFALMEGAAKPANQRDEDVKELLRTRFRLQEPSWLADRLALDSLKHDFEELSKNVDTTMVMEEMAKPRKTYLLNRGVYDKPDTSEVLHASVPASLGAMDESLPRNRLGLARWLMDPKHPLTARVRVNHYWQMYFGAGLVKTSEDFGTQGVPPSHPELLDWLAVEFIESGWDVKAMQKRIVMSATYRQSSKLRGNHLEEDPENILLARAPRFRLSAEMLRDQALWVSGLLNTQLGGPSVMPYQPDKMWSSLTFQNKNKYSTNFYTADTGDKLYRRGLYTYWKRTIPPPRMKIFDTADRERCVIRVENTNTPVQALALLNDPTYIEAARHLAERMINEGGEEPTDRVRYGYKLAMAQDPGGDKGSILMQGLDTYGSYFNTHPEEAKALIEVGDSEPDGSIEDAELAAYTALASVILNLDEFITRK